MAINEHNYHLAKLFVLTIRQFFENTSLHGFKYLVQSGLNTYEKVIWYIIQIISLTVTGYLFFDAVESFSTKPTFTSLQSVSHPVYEIPFPAVVICSVNRISKKGATEYAKYLSTKTKNYSEEWLFKNVRHLGHVLDLDLEDYDEYVKFQDILDVIDLDNKTNVYDTQDKFEMKISPKCEDILVRCQWGRVDKDCMEVFEYRKTRDGYCCAFNYVRQFNILSEDDVVRPKRSEYTGTNTGLIVILNATTSDFYFPIGNTMGFNVLIFNPTDFPDNQNGGMTSVFVSPNTESFLEIHASTIDADPGVEQYTPIQRGCLFEHELKKQYAGHYSYIDCLLKCKLQRIIALCGCMPFFLPTNFPDGTASSVKCTLAHNKCLNRYQTTVATFWSRFNDDDENLKITEDSIDCFDCLPICKKTSFHVTVADAVLLDGALKQSSSPLLKNLSTYTDISILHVFYPSVTSTLYRADVVLTWEEIISNFGGLLGLCLGFSLISLVEIVYFATVRVYKNIPKAFQTQQDAKQFHQNATKKWPSSSFLKSIQDVYVNDFSKPTKLMKNRF